MLSYDEIRKYRDANNEFTKYMGIVTNALDEGYAEGEMEIKKEHENVVGSLHGGVLFTLADTIGGAAASSRGMMVTTVSSDFHFLTAGMDVKKLYATAKELKHGKKLSVYDVKVCSDQQKLLAYGVFTYYNLGIPFSL